MNRLALFGLTALTITIFAEDAVAARTRSSENKTQVTPTPAPTAATLATARPESDNGWYVFADALYWHADVGDTDWALKVENPTASDTTGPVHHLDFKWSWGFRVGVGMNMDHDQWDTNLFYTWFHTHNSNGVGTDIPPGVIRDNIGLVGPNVRSGKIDWDVHFSMFDWQLGRWFYVSKALALRPHVGVKGGWIHQPVREHITGTTTGITGTHHLSNDFWGVGASAGFDTLWVLGNAGARNDHRFCFFGDFGGALMYGHFDVKDKTSTFTDGALSSVVQFTNLDRNLQVTMLQGILGFSWDTGFNRNRTHFTFRIGYEFQYWLRQNQMIREFSTPGNGIRTLRFSEDLGLQGLTADFRFDF